jgi:hypothetical protein
MVVGDPGVRKSHFGHRYLVRETPMIRVHQIVPRFEVLSRAKGVGVCR